MRTTKTPLLKMIVQGLATYTNYVAKHRRKIMVAMPPLVLGSFIFHPSSKVFHQVVEYGTQQEKFLEVEA